MAVCNGAGSVAPGVHRFVVPFGAGPTDVQARWLAQRLARELDAPVVVENRPGAGGMKGTECVAHASPDGLTWLAANPGPLTVGPHVRGDSTYDPLRDLAPVVLIATVPSVIAVHPALHADSIAAFIALDRAAPDTLRWGSPGLGTVGHLALALFQSLAGTRMRHVPQDGLEAAIPLLVAGGIDALIVPMPDARPLARAGKIRALANTRRQRSPLWPELPTVEEGGVAGFESFNWNGVAAPAGTVAASIARMNGAVNRVLASREARQYFGANGYEIAGGTPETFRDFVASEHVKWRGVVRQAGVAAA